MFFLFLNSAYIIKGIKKQVILIKILAVSGSPRKKGNTSLLLDKALDYAIEEGIEVEKIELADYHYSDCVGCEGCKDTFNCVIRDDMQLLYPKILSSDALILGSPTYFYNMTAKMKAFIDRLYCYEIFDARRRDVWLPLNECTGIKYALIIAVCEQKNEDDMGVTADMMAKAIESLGYRVIESVKILNAFKRGDVLNAQDELTKVREASKKLVHTLQLKKKTIQTLNQSNK